jgi:hypothetical protein
MLNRTWFFDLLLFENIFKLHKYFLIQLEMLLKILEENLKSIFIEFNSICLNLKLSVFNNFINFQSH